MVDHTRSTGSTATMLIRDTGTHVQFWLRAGNTTSYDHDLQYGFTVNGVSDNTNTFRFVSGGSWQMIRQWAVSYSQTVQWRLEATGTAGIGGPTVFSVWIDRHRVPDAPSAPRASLIKATSMVIKFDDPADIGGTALDGREIVYRKAGADTSTNVHVSSWDRNSTITGLTAGTSYYFYARVHNEKGWGPYSPRTTATTLDEPDVPGVVTFSELQQRSVKVSFIDGDNNGTAITGRQVGYSLTTGNPTNLVTYSGPTTITGLQPATKYYFRSRTQNSIGWSNWGPTSEVTTLAGVRINVNGVWKTAIPYVKVNGVWRIARPWGRQFGYWEETT